MTMTVCAAETMTSIEWPLGKPTSAEMRAANVFDWEGAARRTIEDRRRLRDKREANGRVAHPNGGEPLVVIDGVYWDKLTSDIITQRRALRAQGSPKA